MKNYFKILLDLVIGFIFGMLVYYLLFRSLNILVFIILLSILFVLYKGLKIFDKLSINTLIGFILFIVSVALFHIYVIKITPIFGSCRRYGFIYHEVYKYDYRDYLHKNKYIKSLGCCPFGVEDLSNPKCIILFDE